MPNGPRGRAPTRRDLLLHRLALAIARPLIRPRTIPSAGRPRVTFLVMTAYGMSGIVRAVFTLAGHLAERNDVEVVSVRRTRDEPFFPVPPGVRLTALDDPPASSVRGPRGYVRAILRHFRTRLVHPGDIAARKTTLWTDLLLVRRLRRMRTGAVICTRPSLNILGAHLVRPGLVVVGQEQMNLARRSPEKQAAIRRSHRALDAVAVLTKSDRCQYLAALGEDARIVVIPNPVPALGGQRSDVSRPVVLAVGRLTPQKGFDRLIRAFAEVARQEPRWTLSICGRGYEHDALQALIVEAGMADNVTLRGAVQDIGREMEQASLFAMSSRWEGFPLVLVEAMSKGLPVVAFDCPTGPADIVEHGRTGILVPNGDRKAFAQAMLELMRDEEKRRRFGAAAAERAEQFGIARVGAQWDELLAELLAADQPRTRLSRLQRRR
jgi:glycosyltransferase involved in cell wall biosynthesis